MKVKNINIIIIMMHTFYKRQNDDTFDLAYYILTTSQK